MATLPVDGLDVSQGVIWAQEPDLTFGVDPKTHRITGLIDGFLAVKQTVEIIFSVERFFWQIYSPNFGMQWQGLLGENPAYVAMDLQRRAKDAISADSRLLGIRDFAYLVEGDVLTASFTVQTVHGDVPQQVAVSL